MPSPDRLHYHARISDSCIGRPGFPFISGQDWCQAGRLTNEAALLRLRNKGTLKGPDEISSSCHAGGQRSILVGARLRWRIGVGLETPHERIKAEPRPTNPGQITTETQRLATQIKKNHRSPFSCPTPTTPATVISGWSVEQDEAEADCFQ